MALLLRGIRYLRFGPLGPVFRTTLLPIRYSGGIQRAANHVIAHAGKILHAAAADQYDRVLLQVMADARNVRSDFNAVGEADARDLPQRRVRLLGGRCVNARTNSALLRAALERRARSLPAWRFPPIT